MASWLRSRCFGGRRVSGDMPCPARGQSCRSTRERFLSKDELARRPMTSRLGLHQSGASCAARATSATAARAAAPPDRLEAHPACARRTRHLRCSSSPCLRDTRLTRASSRQSASGPLRPTTARRGRCATRPRQWHRFRPLCRTPGLEPHRGQVAEAIVQVRELDNPGVEIGALQQMHVGVARSKKASSFHQFSRPQIPVHGLHA